MAVVANQRARYLLPKFELLPRILVNSSLLSGQKVVELRKKEFEVIIAALRTLMAAMSTAQILLLIAVQTLLESVLVVIIQTMMYLCFVIDRKQV
jgi:hypothetical protein